VLEEKMIENWLKWFEYVHRRPSELSSGDKIRE